MSLWISHLPQYWLIKPIKAHVSFMSDFSQIAFVLGLKEGIILSWDKRVYLTLVFAHHNAPQHLGSNDLHLYSLLNTY